MRTPAGCSMRRGWSDGCSSESLFSPPLLATRTTLPNGPQIAGGRRLAGRLLVDLPRLRASSAHHHRLPPAFPRQTERLIDPPPQKTTRVEMDSLVRPKSFTATTAAPPPPGLAPSPRST